MASVYIGLGSNLKNPFNQIQSVYLHFASEKKVKLIKRSSFYQSKPLGPANQPDYINAVAFVETELAPLDLLDYLQQIENLRGRVRNERWGARTIDLDILLYDDKILDNARLTIPHPGLKTREFVLYPLQEIAPGLRLPTGERVSQLVRFCQRQITVLEVNDG